MLVLLKISGLFLLAAAGLLLVMELVYMLIMRCFGYRFSINLLADMIGLYGGHVQISKIKDMTKEERMLRCSFAILYAFIIGFLYILVLHIIFGNAKPLFLILAILAAIAYFLIDVLSRESARISRAMRLKYYDSSSAVFTDTDGFSYVYKLLGSEEELATGKRYLVVDFGHFRTIRYIGGPEWGGDSDG